MTLLEGHTKKNDAQLLTECIVSVDILFGSASKGPDIKQVVLLPSLMISIHSPCCVVAYHRDARCPFDLRTSLILMGIVS